MSFVGFNNRLPDHVKVTVLILRKHVARWCAERPLTALFIVMLSTVLVLPLITASVLMPIALLVDFSTYLGTNGWLYVIYMLLFQGVTLALLIMFLFVIAFIVASSATMLHSYGVTTNIIQKKIEK